MLTTTKAIEDTVDDIDACPICLHNFKDRTIVPVCAHEFCFACILEWTEQSRKCPLCNQLIGDYLIHHVRGRYDYQKHYILDKDLAARPGPSRRTRRERIHREEMDRLDQSIERRKAVYEWGLYAKHVASNSYTKYRPYPTPAQFSSSSEIVRRTTMFLRRELRVWPHLDVEFLTTFTISVMKSIDIRSESAVKLIAEFLDPDGGNDNAQHFAHEVYSYVRSPYKDLFVYDTVVQYDDPPERDSRWRLPSPRQPSRSRSPRRPPASPPAPAPAVRRPRSPSPPSHRRGRRSRSPASHRSEVSWSPSGRTYPSTGIHEQSSSPAPIIRSSAKGKERERSSSTSRARRRRQRSDAPPPTSAEPEQPTNGPGLEDPVPEAPVVEVTMEEPEVRTPLPDRPKRPPRSALESLHAHLAGGKKSGAKGKGKESVSDTLGPLAQPNPQRDVGAANQEELKKRLVTLKAESVDGGRANGSTARPSKDHSVAKEKSLKLRARLAAEKRKSKQAEGI